MPVVFLLGNHSSGKSTFINYITGVYLCILFVSPIREVQHTGVAPTDDSFTVIVPGDEISTKDGRTLVDDPDFGFGGLQRFGLSFLSHLSMKVRNDIQTKDIILVDSPGMIDNPSIGLSKNSSHDRGYDFMSVTKWFADKADVILFFFDPDKPGTTGETLQALTQALQGQDAKLRIILNKVDQFAKVHDFGRAYGALAWNLAKVIPRKDMPEIFTMCVPHDKEMNEPTSPCIPLEDLQHVRGQVLEMVMNAPLVRLDNMISQLSDATHLLLLHSRMISTLKATQSKMNTQKWVSAIGSTGIGLAAAWIIAWVVRGVWEIGRADWWERGVWE